MPPARVSEVNVIYNSAVPRRVDQAYVDPNQVQIVDTNLLEETRTLWFDSTRGQILAYNVEGRVFVELLGELHSDGSDAPVPRLCRLWIFSSSPRPWM